MNLKNQVTNLELSKKLKELGVKQDSYFYWYYDRDTVENSWMITKIDLSYFDDEWISAFTVAELGEILWSIFEKNGWELIYKAYGEVFDFKGTGRIGEVGIINLMRKPDMSAKMLIYLLENKLICN